MLPDISVVIPMYNAAPWIEATLASVRDQTFPADRLEIIVVDDRSTDDSVAIARAFFARHRMHGVVLESTVNKGASVARNRGWAVASGSWIQFLDADDLLAPGKIERQWSHIADKDDDVAVVCSPWQRLLLEGGAWKPGGPVIRPELEGTVILKIVALNAGFVGPALIRKRHLELVSGFSDDVCNAEDEHMLLKIVGAGGRVVEAPGAEPLFFVRQTPGSKSRSSVYKLARQHIQNMVVAERMLREAQGGISAEDRQAIASLSDWTLSQLYEHDRPAFHKYLAWLRGVHPGFIPTHSLRLRLATHLVGYENAERIAHVYRRVKAWYARRIGAAAGLWARIGGRLPWRWPSLHQETAASAGSAATPSPSSPT